MLPKIAQAGIDTVSFYLCLEGSRRSTRSPVCLESRWHTGERCSASMRRGARGLTRSVTERSGDPSESGCTCFPSWSRRTSCARSASSRVGYIMRSKSWRRSECVSYMTPYVTRLDVAADGCFSSPHTARNFLHAVHGCRVPNGGRTGAAGDPIGTVYLMTRTGRDKTGRVYDKGREIQERVGREDVEGLPGPNELMRVESVHRFDPESVPVEAVAGIARDLWAQRFLSLVPDYGRVQVIPFDRLRACIVQSVKNSRMKPSQAERMRLFLELEATGEADTFYGSKRYGQRRREARALGLRVEDAARTEVDFDVAAILRAYAESDAWTAAGSGALAEAA